MASITHGYRDIFDFGAQGLLRDYDPGYQSAPCHNNTICPVAAGWDQQISSTAMFLRPDGNGCTGSLVNNTAQPGTPYFFFANHCYTPTANQWVFYFNYESPTCVGTVGPTTETITGATLKAAYYYDDFGLLQLNSAPPLSYGPYYAGWDRSGNTPTSTTIVQHPNYDVKKISFDYGPATSYVDGIGIQMWGSTWDSGVVQAVSSGAPCFDQNKRIVGHMAEGAYSCTVPAQNTAGSGKFSASWDGASASTRLRDWLDPANTTVVMDGYDPANTPQPTLPVRLKVFLEGPYNTQTLNMNGTLRANGLVPPVEPYTGLGYMHAGGGGGETTTPAVLALTGSASPVDWVVVELRNKNDASQVVATRSALLLRNGSVVGVNGSSDVTFQIAVDDYYIAVRHRNHLGIMTQDPQSLNVTPVLRDLTNGSVPLNGGSGYQQCQWGACFDRRRRDTQWAGEVCGKCERSRSDPHPRRRYSTYGHCQWLSARGPEHGRFGEIRGLFERPRCDPHRDRRHHAHRDAQRADPLEPVWDLLNEGPQAFSMEAKMGGKETGGRV
ncbi:MAG: hypothetical protein IPH53_15485 [Flavobacteriales bacterium]|nr:hypothetical protein [Flavobacteriales bacterium]